MARVLYKNVKNRAAANRAMAKLRKAKLNPYTTDAGWFSSAKKGLDVYAIARKKESPWFQE